LTTVGPYRGGADEKMLGEKALATIILLKGSNQQFCAVEITVLDSSKSRPSLHHNFAVTRTTSSNKKLYRPNYFLHCSVEASSYFESTTFCAP